VLSYVSLACGCLCCPFVHEINLATPFDGPPRSRHCYLSQASCYPGALHRHLSEAAGPAVRSLSSETGAPATRQLRTSEAQLIDPSMLLALKESVDSWPMAITILDKIGGMPAHP
jgi:hypothetical protein